MADDKNVYKYLKSTYGQTTTGLSNGTPYRYGTAAAGTSTPGQPTPLGMAFDLGNGEWLTLDDFNTFVRSQSEITQKSYVEALEREGLRKMYEEELERATNLQERGEWMTNADYQNRGDSDEPWYEQAANSLVTGTRWLTSNLQEEAVGLIRPPSLFGDNTPRYEDYKGLLTEEEFNSFDEDVQRHLINQAIANEDLASMANLPGIKQTLYGFGQAYRGAITGIDMMRKNTSAPFQGRFSEATEFFNRGNWAESWKESNDRSIGNSLLDYLLNPVASDEQMDELRRNSAVYQVGSTVAEIGAGWYLDGGVLVARGAGNLAKIKKNELPRGGIIGKAVQQDLRGETITTRTPLVRTYAPWRAERIREGQRGVETYARTVDFAEFQRLPMFRNRGTTNGTAAARAVWLAANGRLDEALDIMPEEDLMDLTWRAAHADPRAWARIEKLKRDPRELAKYGPNGAPFLDALEATKTRAKQLTDEIEQMQRQGTTAGSRFHQWETDTELQIKTKQLEDAQAALDRYTDYGEWLETAKGSQLGQVRAPSERAMSRYNSGRHKFYLNNQFGFGHRVTTIGRQTFVKRASLANMHDVDSGVRSIHNQFDNFAQLGYINAEARSKAIEDWTRAATPMERYVVMHSIETNHLLPAIAQKLGVSTDTVRAVYGKVRAEENRMKQGILNGSGRMYQSGPTLAQRLADASSGTKIVSENADTGMVTLRVMDGSTLVEMEVPSEALTLWSDPTKIMDPTQTPNYYQPIDTRRFYLELKRHRDILDELDAGIVRRGGAELGDVVDRIGTTFNNLWKPLQLWRLAWPQRVLMDEGLRAMAVIGPMYWITGPGAEAALKGAGNLAHAAQQRWLRYKTNKALDIEDGPIGPGPVAREAKRSPRAQREQEVAAAVHEPHYSYPRLVPEDYDQIVRSTAALDGHIRASRAMEALRKEEERIDEDINRIGAPGRNLHPALIAANAKRVALADAAMDHPVHKIYLNLVRNPHTNVREFRVFDPATGRPLFENNRRGKGYVVPLLHIKPAALTPADPNLAYWYAKNADLLARRDIVLITRKVPGGTPRVPNYELVIARRYQRSKRAQANNLLRRVHDGRPQSMVATDEPAWMVNLDSGKREYVLDADYMSPVTEQLYRMFRVEQERSFEPGMRLREFTEDAPTPDSDVWHGTGDTLPDDLLPRDDVPVASGHMMGAGLYTTVERNMAATYAGFDPEHVYTIRSVKDGKTYKVFDTDKPMVPEDGDEVAQWLEHNAPEYLLYDRVVEEFRDLYRRAVGDWDRIKEFYNTADNGPMSWANFYEYIAANYGEHNHFHKLLHQFLEYKGYGAITHVGGTRRAFGSPEPHQVYIWFHPEELVVRSSFSPTGKYQTIPEMLMDGYSVENVVPESQITRVGNRNPMVRRLETIHKQRMARQQEVGPTYVTDATHDELLRQEQELMEALGLEYSHNFRRSPLLRDNLPDGQYELLNGANRRLVDDNDIPTARGDDLQKQRMTPGGDHWYYVKDEGRFRRTVDEAKVEDAKFEARNRVGADIRRVENDEVLDVADAFDQFDVEIDSPLSWLARQIFKRREQGQGVMAVRTADGKTVYVNQVFEGNDGAVMRALTGSDRTYDYISEGHGGALTMLRKAAAGHKVYHPPKFTERAMKAHTAERREAVAYFGRWADMLNDQVANSPVWSKMLRGWDDDKIVDWLKHSPEGAALRRELPTVDRSPELWVMEHRQKLDYYLPSGKLQRLLAKGPLKPSDLRRNVHNDDLPDIFGPDVDLDHKRFLARVADFAWKSLGTIPTDALSRHPFAKAMYDLKMKSLIGQTDSDWLTPQMVADYEKLARDFALEQVRKTLFDLTDTTNFTDAIRFIAPFWAAQQEAIVKWLRIIADRPETVARFFMGQRAVYNNFTVVDEDGVPTDDPALTGGMQSVGLYHPEDRVILRIPDFMRHGPLGKALETVGEIGIPLGSANTVLQGETPLLPGVGPLVTIPMDKFLKTMDDHGVRWSEDTWYRWMFPVGRPSGGWRGVTEQMLPGWGKRIQSAFGPEDDISKANMYFNVGREMTLANQKKGLPPPTPEEIEKQTRWLWTLRMITSWGAPVQMEYRPKNQYWLDQAHAFRQKYGPGYMEKFMEEFGKEATLYAMSSSTATAGIPPTLQGMEEWAPNRELIAKYPQWGSAIVSPDAFLDDYSQDTYRAQFEIPLGPGDSRTLRDLKDPTERFAEAEETMGWSEFRKFNAAVYAEMYANGWTSLNQKEAERLRMAKQLFMDELGQKYPAWRESYIDFTNDIDIRIEELESFAFNKEFNHRPDMLGVRQYLILRDEVAAELDRHYLEDGGSRNLQAEENGALADWFYRQVGELILDNPAFGEFYSRWLDGDTLERGSGHLGTQ